MISVQFFLDYKRHLIALHVLLIDKLAMQNWFSFEAIAIYG